MNKCIRSIKADVSYLVSRMLRINYVYLNLTPFLTELTVCSYTNHTPSQPVGFLIYKTEDKEHLPCMVVVMLT